MTFDEMVDLLVNKHGCVPVEPLVDRERDDIFTQRFKKSIETVKMTAAWLKSRGYKDVKVVESRIAPSYSQWRKYVDNGDIYVGKHRVEVKGLGHKYKFTKSSEYPWDNVIVCAKHSFDMATPKPVVYLLWNNARTHVGCIPTSTYNDWKVKTIKDPNYPRNQDFYVTGKENMIVMERFKKPEQLSII